MRSKFTVVALLLAVLAHAADGPIVEAHLKFISTTRPLVGVGIMHGKKAEGFVIPTDMFSDEIVYRGPVRLELVELAAVSKPAENTPPPETTKAAGTAKKSARGVKAKPSSYEFTPTGKPPLAWIDLPITAGRLNLILLVTPGRDNGITAIPDVPGSFPPGSNRYLNLCAFPIVVKTPSGNQTIPAGGTKVIRPGSKDNDYYDLQLKSVVNEEEKLVFSSRVYHMESVRKLFVLAPGPGDDGRVLVRDIEDRPPSAKGQTLTPNGPKGAK
jgi:hypothetical protein